MEITKGYLLPLREKMLAAGMDAWIVPMGDYHGSEYLSPYFKTIRFLTGFTGSAGTLAVTKDRTGFWTDGRYYIQAAAELEGSGITMMPAGLPQTPTLEAFLREELPEGAAVGFDGAVVTVQEAERWQKALEDKHISFRTEQDLAGELWTDRPPQVFHPLRLIQPALYAADSAEKLRMLRADMKKAGAEAHILTSLDDIAWLMNARGSDVAFSPVFFAFLLVTEEKAELFCREEAVPEEARKLWETQGFTLRPYECFQAAVAALQAESLLLDPSRVSCGAFNALPDTVRCIKAANPTTLRKMVKDSAECLALRESHRRDGIAMVKFLYWLKNEADIASLSETDAAAKLDGLRREAGAYDLSFETIAAFGENAALCHYRPEPGCCAALAPRGFLLVDSGGLYDTGTTDITRTIVLGPLSDAEKQAYTAVLRGHLRLQAARFPKGVTGQNLDALAREPLWALGMDFRHGTGHGVGFQLNVHEGPNAFRWQGTGPAIVPGTVTTDEPGYYEEGAYGVRIENELLCVEKETTPWGCFYGFEPLTLCPIDTEPVLREAMDASEIAELNRYHAGVYEALKDEPAFSPEEREWLRGATRPL